MASRDQCKFCMMAAEFISRSRSIVCMGGSYVRHSLLIHSNVTEEAYFQDTQCFREDVSLSSFLPIFWLDIDLTFQVPSACWSASLSWYRWGRSVPWCGLLVRISKELLRDIADGSAALLCGIRDTCYNIEVGVLYLVVRLGCWSAPVVGLFFGAATVAGLLSRSIIGILIVKQISGAFSGLLAFGIGYMGGMEGLEAWSWIFVSSFKADFRSNAQNSYAADWRPCNDSCSHHFFLWRVQHTFDYTEGWYGYDRLVLVDFPETAKFLTPEERAFVVWRKSEWGSKFWEGRYDSDFFQNTTIHQSARKRSLLPSTSGRHSKTGK